MGVWLNNQRALKRRGQLSTEREMRLQKLVDEGKLSWEQREMLGWDEHFKNMIEFGESNGHCNVPYSTKGTAAVYVTITT